MTSKHERKSQTFTRETFQGKGYFTSINKNLLSGRIGEELYKHPRALGIYIYFINQYNQGPYNKKLGFTNSNKNNLSYPKKDYIKFMNIITFNKNLDIVIELGLIRVIKNRYATRECTIFGLSDMWLNYGKNEFIVKNNEKRKQII
jgi:hypothetical protein